MRVALTVSGWFPLFLVPAVPAGLFRAAAVPLCSTAPGGLMTANTSAGNSPLPSNRSRTSSRPAMDACLARQTPGACEAA
jgi:hypothetical protein